MADTPTGRTGRDGAGRPLGSAPLSSSARRREKARPGPVSATSVVEGARMSAAQAWRWLLRRVTLWPAALFAIVFIASVSVAAAWARERLLPAPDRIATETRLVRVEFAVEDEIATEKDRELARQRQPRVFIAQQAVFEEIESALLNLPASVREAADVDALAPEIRSRFDIQDDARLAALRRRAEDAAMQSTWQNNVRNLMDLLRGRPIVTSEDLQLQRLAQSPSMELRRWDGTTERRDESQAINLQAEDFASTMATLVRRSNFDPSVVPSVVAMLATTPRATYRFDAPGTDAAREQAAASVPMRVVQHRVGDVLVRRGERLDQQRAALLQDEREAWLSAAPPATRLPALAGTLGAVLIVSLGLITYLASFARVVSERPRRIAWIGVLTAAATIGACVGVVLNPEFLVLFATAPTVFVAASLAVAFDRRVALGVSALQAVLVCIALALPIGILVVSLVGSAIAAWSLTNVRTRRQLLRGAGLTGAGMAIAGFTVELLETPMSAAAWTDILSDLIQAGLGGLLVGFLVMGLLPLLERAFDVVTPLTLIELRDPKQPLLRELAQRAPGSYTHSLGVATIAEAAADSIGADGLHVYAGSLYHDIGKMLKPEYFVENQGGGVNPHEKLSPAMSLLVIVGHVKEGMALAREHGLPRSIRHYIEAHHGTTLVEYFFDRARRQAGEDPTAEPFEFGYRYPGPKPQTREAAILMLSDAVEGAARSLAEPTPSRIESLVHSIAQRRLADGQFDECDLTLRDLHQIEQSIIKSLNSIYHGRIAYPGQMDGKDRPARPPAPRTGPAARGVTA